MAQAPTPLSGFPELLPAQRMIEARFIDDLRRTFELHGFAPIETRAVEPIDRLTGGADVDKEIYAVRRLAADPAEHEDAELGLHFDLTVPFARYVLEHAGKLEFPFRRYQIQKVWRGERPQGGRYREFTQADIDIVGKDELSFHHDVEVARVMAEALAALPLPPLRLQVNNRKLSQGFFVGLGAPDLPAVLRVIDKLDKVPSDVVRTMLQDEASLSADQADLCLAFADIRTTDTGFHRRVRDFGITNELVDEGLGELAAVIEGCADLNSESFSVQADLRIARGLDYYTGTVFETRMSGYEALGSICSGGRYDELATDGRTSYPGVGISLGLSRLLVPMFADGVLRADRSVPSAVLVALPDEPDRAACAAVAQRLRARGIPTEVAVSAQKYGKQIRYAQRRGIPYVWFPGSAEDPDTHGVRDIRSGDQVAADPDTWQPPEADLHIQLIDTTEERQS